MVALVGLVYAVLSGTGLVGGGSPVDTTAAAYLDGHTYAITNFSGSTTEGAVCAKDHATGNSTQWIQGCRDGWAVAAFSFTSPLRGGPIP